MLQPGTHIGPYKPRPRGRGGRGTAPPLLRTFGLLVLLGAVGIPVSAQDKDRKAFRDGMDARRDQRWKAVAENMRQAIADDGKESKDKVGRRKFGVPIPGSGDEYLPHYYLGEALFRMGDCLGA